MLGGVRKRIYSERDTLRKKMIKLYQYILTTTHGKRLWIYSKRGSVCQLQILVMSQTQLPRTQTAQIKMLYQIPLTPIQNEEILMQFLIWFLITNKEVPWYEAHHFSHRNKLSSCKLINCFFWSVLLLGTWVVPNEFLEAYLGEDMTN